MIFRSPPRKRLTSAQREELYLAEKQKAVAAGLGEFPICKLCGIAVLPGQFWHENHNKHLPHAIGGEPDGLSHARCNRRWNNLHDTPLVAKLKRIVRKRLDIHRPRQPLAGGNGDRLKKKMDGTVVLRTTGERAT